MDGTDVFTFGSWKAFHRADINSRCGIERLQDFSSRLGGLASKFPSGRRTAVGGLWIERRQH